MEAKWMAIGRTLIVGEEVKDEKKKKDLKGFVEMLRLCHVGMLTLTCEDVFLVHKYSTLCYGDRPWLRQKNDHLLGRRGKR